jgi:hypothetical protein
MNHNQMPEYASLCWAREPLGTSMIGVGNRPRWRCCTVRNRRRAENDCCAIDGEAEPAQLCSRQADVIAALIAFGL